MGRIATFIAALLVAAGGGGGTSITDPAGDSGTAPDITGLDIAVDDNGLSTFRVDVALPDTATVSTVSVYIDADNNPKTGDPANNGADYVFDDDQSTHTYLFYGWNTGTQSWDSISDLTTINVRHDPNGVTFSINRSRLGNASQINVFAQSVLSLTQKGPQDRVPNVGTTAFDLAPFTLDVVTFHVGTVKAGGQLTIAMAAKQSDNGQYVSSSDTVTCALTSAGSTLPARTAAILTSNGTPTGTCVWNISKKLKGKTLHATITESTQGRSVTKTATVKVR